MSMVSPPGSEREGYGDKENKDPLDYIYFEEQYGNLCGVHCINNLLQESAFDAVSLTEIGKAADKMEQELRFEEKELEKSLNYDDTGYFSINVLELALHQVGLELVLISSTSNLHAAQARSTPIDETAYIIHKTDHWYCLRRFGRKQWILLDSIKKGPLEIDDSELAMTVLLKDARVYVVVGNIERKESDNVYERVVRTGTQRHVFHDEGRTLGSSSSQKSDDDLELERAIQLSLGKTEREILSERRANFFAKIVPTKSKKKTNHRKITSDKIGKSDLSNGGNESATLLDKKDNNAVIHASTNQKEKNDTISVSTGQLLQKCRSELKVVLHRIEVETAVQNLQNGWTTVKVKSKEESAADIVNEQRKKYNCISECQIKLEDMSVEAAIKAGLRLRTLSFNLNSVRKDDKVTQVCSYKIEDTNLGEVCKEVSKTHDGSSDERSNDNETSHAGVNLERKNSLRLSSRRCGQCGLIKEVKNGE